MTKEKWRRVGAVKLYSLKIQFVSLSAPQMENPVSQRSERYGKMER